MDTSVQYIKMCEKAEEIQKAWKPHKFDDYIQLGYHDKPVKIIGGICVGDYFIGAKDCGEVWLPTQEQLQEIIIPTLKSRYNKYHDLEKMERIANWIVRIFWGFTEHNGREIHSNNITELWLAFVMHEKYNKIWTGEKWVKEL